MSQKNRWLLKKIAAGSDYLSMEEIARAITCLIPDNPDLAKKIFEFVCSKKEEIQLLGQGKRKNVLLIVDEVKEKRIKCFF